VQIKFHSAKQIDVTEQGENQTVTLDCILPPDFAGVTMGQIDFIIGTGTTKTYPFPAAFNSLITFDGGILHITLWDELTASRFLRLQVTGYTTTGKRPKTPLSELLRFSASIGDGTGGDAPPGVIEELEMAKHTHSNKPLLDLLTDEGNGLLYDGEPLGDAMTYAEARAILEGSDENGTT
jgi:hypothetical protein